MSLRRRSSGPGNARRRYMEAALWAIPVRRAGTGTIHLGQAPLGAPAFLSPHGMRVTYPCHTVMMIDQWKNRNFIDMLLLHLCLLKEHHIQVQQHRKTCTSLGQLLTLQQAGTIRVPGPLNGNIN